MPGKGKAAAFAHGLRLAQRPGVLGRAGILMRRHGQIDQRLLRLAQPHQHRAEQIVPFRAAGGDVHEHPARGEKIAVVNELLHAFQRRALGLLAGNGALQPVQARPIGRVDLGHLLVRPVALRPLRKAVGMPAARQRAIRRADVVARGRDRNFQNLISVQGAHLGNKIRKGSKEYADYSICCGALSSAGQLSAPQRRLHIMILLALAEQERQRHREGGNFRRGDGPPDAVHSE